MPDLARFLPLSQRPQHDESAVSSHWGREISAVLGSLSHELRVLPAERWNVASLRTGWSIRDSVAFLTTRFTSTRRQNATATAFGLLENMFSRSAAESSRARRAAEGSTPAELVEALDAFAEAAAAQRCRTGIRELDDAVLCAIDSTLPLGIPLALPATATGAVALRRALIAPTEIKAVIRNHTIVATDAGWSFGQGPELRDTALGLLLFLTGRSDIAPRRV